MDKQLELPVLGDCSYSVRELPKDEVAMCSTIFEAYRLCMRRSIVWRSQETWAELLGMTKGAFNQVLNGGSSDRKRHMPDSVRRNLQKLAGNKAINQWEDLELSGELHCQRSIEEQEAQIKERLYQNYLKQQAS